MRCQALLLAVISVCVCTLRGGGGVEAFSRIPPYRSFVVKQRHQQQEQLRSSSPPLLLQLASSSTTVSDQNNNNNAKKPKRYHWLRPTLAIAVPALIGMMAGTNKRKKKVCPGDFYIHVLYLTHITYYYYCISFTIPFLQIPY